jgi:hypothetical protein
LERLFWGKTCNSLTFLVMATHVCGGARRRRSGGGPGRGCARRPVGIPSPPRGGRWKPRSRARPGTVGG